MSTSASTSTSSSDLFDELDAQLNSSSTPLAQRFRALFTLKSLGGHRAIDVIGKGFDGQSALLGHELAYCLGQINDPYALPILRKVLEDEDEHPMVRHEAAEAMGAISDLSSLPVLKKYLTHPIAAIRETAEIALAKIEWDNSEEGKKEKRPNEFNTIDPAPASHHSPLASGSKTSTTTTPIPELQATLNDKTKSLFERYRAMFALRNDGSKKAVLALATGFEDESALFRHEIAYVFGQLSSPYSVPSLIKVLSHTNEEDMVRHEAAEALGGIATEECLPILEQFAKDENVPRVVRESCEVALDMYEYENSNEFVPLPTLVQAS
ncbi:deoxyhypusine hydroxylase [Microbotryum lychnidis-dioicae p1A1 Lamole]|uniref:Deoxyhypusine hydroxylase n=1 Tax=Microbotryum lychnidis-dioicae (strain p1A1 Lamole / MvSl-1064) TaxID=683840 RepID=U5HHZ5_USTV1|nr:deoxyhypusine hydroxylase [Microbotryum lychnidis-dioicae p1A1 Lamole]|eukprot:KDE02806.1 deoxyhypusine hydroxylase [Microbotryum lychnidis-dioicae p1A1 Lamole]